MGCEGCLTSSKGQSYRLEAVKQEAEKYAAENKKTVAIFKEGNEYFFQDAQSAISSGIPILFFISQHH